MAVVWILLAAVSAISRNISRLAVCLGYMLAHGLVVTFLRYKFSHYGYPGTDANDAMVTPLEHYMDTRAQREHNRRSLSGAQLTFSAGMLDPAPSAGLGGGSSTAAIGVPAYSLPVLYAVVGRCAADCTCPYCCIAAAAAASSSCIPGMDDPAAAAVVSSRERLDLSRVPHGCMRHGLVPSGRVDELYLPGALLPEAAAPDNDRGPGPPELAAQFSRHPADLAPATTPSASPSARAGSRSRSVSRRAEPDGGGRVLFGEPLSSRLLAVGVPVPPALLLVEGVPLVEVLRGRRAGAHADNPAGGGAQGSLSAPAAATDEARVVEAVTAAGSAASRIGDQQQGSADGAARPAPGRMEGGGASVRTGASAAAAIEGGATAGVGSAPGVRPAADGAAAVAGS